MSSSLIPFVWRFVTFLHTVLLVLVNGSYWGWGSKKNRALCNFFVFSSVKVVESANYCVLISLNNNPSVPNVPPSSSIELAFGSTFAHQRKSKSKSVPTNKSIKKKNAARCDAWNHVNINWQLLKTSALSRPTFPNRNRNCINSQGCPLTRCETPTLCMSADNNI